MQTGVFFGSFDPPHFGHLRAIQKLLKQGACDQVWLMPCFSHVWGKELAPAKHRFAMLKFLENKNIKVSDLEIKAKKALYTIETLATLKKKYPQHQFSLVISEKTKDELSEWKDYKELIRGYRLLVLPEVKGISSSMIREKVKLGLPITGLVPQKVAEYIEKHKLYRNF